MYVLIIAIDTARNIGKWNECFIHLLSTILECHKSLFYDVAHLHFIFVAADFFLRGGGELLTIHTKKCIY